MKITEKHFVVEASRDRVWRLIGKVIFSSLPGMENIDIVDENRFRAIMRMKVLFVEVKMNLQGEMVDMSPPDSFAVRLALEGPGRLFRIDQRVSFSMAAVEKEKTAVACELTAEKMGILFRGQARRFATSVFDAIEKRLKELL